MEKKERDKKKITKEITHEQQQKKERRWRISRLWRYNHQEALPTKVFATRTEMPKQLNKQAKS